MLDPITAATAPDPYPYYRELVEHRPVYRDERLGLWVVSGATAVDAMLAAPAARVRPPAEPVAKALSGSPAGTVFGAFARMTDGPVQAAMKQAIQAALAEITAEQVSRLSRAWLADRFADGGPVDIRALDEVAGTLPVAVVAGLLGIPESAHAGIREAVAAFAAGIAPSASAEQAVAGSDAASLLLEALRALPRGAGVLSTLTKAAEGQAATDILANALGLLFQTYDATAGLIGNTLVAAARHREVWTRAANGARLMDFVDEVQRHDPPVHNTRRFLAAEITLEGQTLPQGDGVLLVLAAANHDAVANAAPERFDIDRKDRRSFTFGAGRHACPGVLIATVIAAVAAEALVPRLARIDRLAHGIGYRPLPNARVPVFARAG
jgi:cytochrome P450